MRGKRWEKHGWRSSNNDASYIVSVGKFGVVLMDDKDGFMPSLRGSFYLSALASFALDEVG